MGHLGWGSFSRHFSQNMCMQGYRIVLLVTSVQMTQNGYSSKLAYIRFFSATTSCASPIRLSFRLASVLLKAFRKDMLNTFRNSEYFVLACSMVFTSRR